MTERSIPLIRLFSAILLPALFLGSAAAGGPSTTGLTSVASSLQGNTFTWDLYNPSGPGDGTPNWDILIWSLQPDDLPAPTEWSAPSGWSWQKSAGGGFRLDDNSRKYEVGGPAVEPGEHMIFTYTIDDAASYAGRLSFLAHVGAVNGTEAAGGGAFRWLSVQTPNGRTWFDRPSLQILTPPVGEPGGALVLAFGLVAAVGALRRR